jgi:hypothetical protein
MNRKEACLVQAAACREQAEADPEHRDHWTEEETKWLQRAAGALGPVVVTFESRDQRLAPGMASM